MESVAPLGALLLVVVYLDEVVALLCCLSPRRDPAPVHNLSSGLRLACSGSYVSLRKLL